MDSPNLRFRSKQKCLSVRGARMVKPPPCKKMTIPFAMRSSSPIHSTGICPKSRRNGTSFLRPTDANRSAIQKRLRTVETEGYPVQRRLNQNLNNKLTSACFATSYSSVRWFVNNSSARAEPYVSHITSAIGRGCVKTQNIGKFMSRETHPDIEKIECSPI